MERHKEVSPAGKVAIITGASRGVGKEAAFAFARRGAKLVLAARTVEPDSKLPGTLGETLQQIEAMGGAAIAVATDLAKEADLHRLVAAAVERFGGVDILVNNAAATAGDYWSDGFLTLSREDWLYQFDVNVHAPFTLMQQVVPIMEARGGGRIVNLTTGSGEVFRQPEEPIKLDAIGGFSLDVPAGQRRGSAACPQEHRGNRDEPGAGGDRAGGNPGQGSRARRQRRRTNGGSGADDRLLLRLRGPDGIHRPTVLGRA
jgi:NAD(P)-dependent dehydrogenase (short-subunit alcohol dehydrogenase family)